MREQRGDRPEAVGIGLDRGGRVAGDGVVTVVLLKNSSIGTSTNVGPRCDEPASVNASSIVGAMSSTVRAVVGRLGDGLEDRRVVELLQAARAPAAVGRATADHDER